MKALPGAEDAEIEILSYDTPSYTGLRYPMEKYYPDLGAGGIASAGAGRGRAPIARCGTSAPVVDKWTFSTNGVGSMGLMGVPTIGFGPGEEEVAHSVGERVPIRHLVEAAQFYAAFPADVSSTTLKKGNG